MQQAMYLPWRGSRFTKMEDGARKRHGDLCHRELVVVGLLSRDNWRIAGEQEVDAWVRHQVRLELCDNVKSEVPIHTQRRCQR